MRIAIVDDEQPARDELRALVKPHRVEIVGEAATAGDADALVRRTRPDVVLLDIHMPGRSGLDLAADWRGIEPPPIVIFVTAFDEHALEAFDREALDYLLKPVNQSRLRRALDRAANRLWARTPVAPPSPAEPTRFAAIRAGSDVRVVLDPSTVEFFYAEKDVTFRRRGRLIADGGTDMERTMTWLSAAAAALVLAAGLALAANAPRRARSQDEAMPQRLAELEALREDVRFLDLVARMELTREQLGSILDVARAAQERVGGRLDEHRDLLDGARRDLESARAQLLKGERPERDLRDSLRHQEAEIRQKAAETAHEVADDGHKLFEALSPTQRDSFVAVRLLRPGVHPDLDKARAELREGLELARGMFDEEFDAVADEGARRFLDRHDQGLHLSEEERDAEAARLVSIAKEARGLEKNADPGLDRLVGRILLEGRIGEIVRTALRIDEASISGELARAFFTPRAVRLIDARLSATR